jgi:hypothetical protein
MMQSGLSTTNLSELVLDAGRDDYYGHAGTWWDVQDSAWLRHLEQPPGTVSVTVRGNPGGEVVMGPLATGCAAVCVQQFDGGTKVRIQQVAEAEPRLIRWGGACSGRSDVCTVIAGGDDKKVTATFGRAIAVTGRTRGTGSISKAGEPECRDECQWYVAPRARLRLIARPDPGARFHEWRGLCQGTERTCVVELRQTRAATVTATFRR